MSAPLQPTLPPHSANFLAEINAQLKQQLDAATNELAYARLKIQMLPPKRPKPVAWGPVLEEHLRLRRIAKYGPGSEELSALQLQLLDMEPGVTSEEVQAESQREAPPSASPDTKDRRAHPARQTLPADLPRVEKVVACTPEQCVCGKCGDGTTVIGYEQSEVLDVEPARYFVQVTRREKRACKPGSPTTGLRRWGGRSAKSRAWPWRRCRRALSTRAWYRIASSSTRL